MKEQDVINCQVDLFGHDAAPQRYGIELAPEIDTALALNAPVFIGVSGGRDSQALAYRVSEHLDELCHEGPRYLIHADLGRVEWKDSIVVCERLAKRLDLELIVVRRQAGDMMDRWLSRWDANVRRYANLETVRLIQPWSSAQWRYCTSEMKSGPLSRKMRGLHPAGEVISAVGIRREESSARAKMPVWKQDDRMTRKRGVGHTWNPILGWSREDVNAYVRKRGDRLHAAYTIYGSTRVSCAYCVLGSLHDLRASSNCTENQAIYREMVDLEVRSASSFQPNRWLGDVAPDLLSASKRAEVAEAKERASVRVAAESRIPPHLMLVKGLPTVLPTPAEADLIADVRREVSQAIGIHINYTVGADVLARYRELLDVAVAKASAGGLALAA